YVDNLLDWGDTLFAQFTMESVNEATMLYVMAADILGRRPTQLAACGESDKPRTYADIAPLLTPTSDFLIEEAEVFTLDLGEADRSKQFVTAGKKSSWGAKSAAFAAVLEVAPLLEVDPLVADEGFDVGSWTPPDQFDGGDFEGQVWKATDGTPLGT